MNFDRKYNKKHVQGLRLIIQQKNTHIETSNKIPVSQTIQREISSYQTNEKEKNI